MRGLRYFLVIISLLSLACCGWVIFDILKNKLLDMPPARSEDNLTFDEEESSTQKTGTFYAPVLLYHHIKKVEPQNSYYVSLEIFDAQMAWIKDNDYEVITLGYFYDAIKGKKKMPEKPAVITFDDGVIDQYQNALPILKKYNFKATFYIKLNNVGDGKGGMSWEMLKDLIKEGMEIESHSMNHDSMSAMEADTLEYEIKESKQVLEENLDIDIKSFAYPGGSYSTATIAALKDAGYLSAVTTRHKVYHDCSENLFEIPRIHIDDEMPTFIDWMQGINLK